MVRTQIYLGKAEAKVLDALAKRTGRTRSQLIREAIDAAYVASPSAGGVEAALVETAGAWRRPRGHTGAAWVERRRRRRLARLHSQG